MSSDVTHNTLASDKAGDNNSASTPVTLAAQARIPTQHGTFTMKLFREDASGLEHVALVMGDVTGSALVRVHSECMTGDVFGSLRCDCGPQLHTALERIGAEGRGVLVYLRQEGRGIGLINKLKAYELQDEGLDTVEANLRLGFAADLRNFEVAAEILDQLGVTSVRLMTNNPRKVATLEKHGVKVVERVPLRSDAQPENERYLATKASKLGHHIDWL
ncbi:MAG: GTP cyclohydrolase II [Burkholderiales bacterium]|nr:GTP cyclohydrolase II [Burkholderiales bacterium]